MSRGSAQIDIDIHRGPGHVYVLVLTQPDGSERVERFHAPERLVSRMIAVQQRLIKRGWVPTSPIGARIPARPRRRGRRWAIARRAISELHRRVTRRLAAAFGL